MPLTRVAILGAGPAGVGAAWQLRVRDKANVVVVEQRDDVGGNAGSFEIEGMPVDYGSHRLHPACEPRILEDLKKLLGPDLLDRPRNGRIRLRGRWIRFPLRPFDMMVRLPPSFALGVAVDAVAKLSGDGQREENSFASVLEAGLGKTICRDFYFPYAAKIWGVPPDGLSPTQAKRRVSANSLGKIVRKTLSVVPGFKAPGAGRFYYPLGGYGQISRAMASAARELGASVRLGARVSGIVLGAPHRIEVESDGRREVFEAEHLWSTLPITLLCRLIKPTAPTEVLEAANQMEYRAMVLVYLIVERSQFTSYDAHYFPEGDIRITRLSEPKNYSARDLPANRTVLCAELPCSVGDDIWTANEEDLGQLVVRDLVRCELPAERVVRSVTTKRLSHAYPIYRTQYEENFRRIDEWVSGLDRLLTFGRQGLFAHDNTHHALAMAYAAVDCLDASGAFDLQLWRGYREKFTSHVVED